LGNNVTTEGAPSGGGLEDHNLAEPREIFFELPPEPASHDFNGRTFKALDAVEITVIHHFEERLHGLGDALVIVNPADLRIDLTFDVNFHLKTVAVHLTAFMVVGQAWKGMGRFEAEVFNHSGTHGIDGRSVLGRG
jgi:hypothetical protein